MNEIINKIAESTLHIDTLETQNSGSDFHEVAVWNVKKALEEAYNAGRNSKKNSKKL